MSSRPSRPKICIFLRIFVLCEGRIRDMEPALGLSYPTIRTRLTALKNKLLGPSDATATARTTTKKPEKEDDAAPEATLKLLDEGKITFDEAMSRIRAGRPKKG